MEPDLRIEVTNEDIGAAKFAWLAARDSDKPDARVEQLFAGYESLIHVQAQQIADEFRARVR